jgi:hypothetical protein
VDRVQDPLLCIVVTSNVRLDADLLVESFSVELLPEATGFGENLALTPGGNAETIKVS